MITTIDGAGRIVIPKALRESLKLSAGHEVDISVSDGRLVIDVPAANVGIDRARRIAVAVPEGPTPALTAEQVRATLDATRR